MDAAGGTANHDRRRRAVRPGIRGTGEGIELGHLQRGELRPKLLQVRSGYGLKGGSLELSEKGEQAHEVLAPAVADGLHVRPLVEVETLANSRSKDVLA